MEFDGSYYLIAENNKIVRSRERNVQAAWIGDLGIAAGRYTFDADGRMIVPEIPTEAPTEAPVLNGPVGEYFYLNNVKQTAYKLIEFEGSYYYIAEYNKYVVGRSRYISSSLVAGTDLKEGYYDFDANGRMIVPESASFLIDSKDFVYVDGVQQKAYKLVQDGDDWYFVAESNKIVKGKWRLLNASHVEGTPFKANVCYYFGDDGRMVMTGPMANGQFYVDGELQKAYKIVGQYNKSTKKYDYYYISTNHLYATNKTAFISAALLEGTGYSEGYYYFNADGIMKIKNGPDDSGYFYMNSERIKGYKLIQYSGAWYFIAEGNKYVKGVIRKLDANVCAGTSIKPGTYSFDADGKLKLN